MKKEGILTKEYLEHQLKWCESDHYVRMPLESHLALYAKQEESDKTQSNNQARLGLAETCKKRIQGNIKTRRF